MAESISAKTAWALAKAIKGGSKKKLPNSGTATVVRVDQDGTHWVRISGSDVETPANGAITADARPGDVVQYHLEDTRISITGNATSPSVGKEYVDERVEPLEAKVDVVARANALLNTATERARSVADAAKSVADAVNQHFFSDTNGVHVTESTQEDWDESHTGANVLINSIGQLFRDGLNNLLTLTTEGNARALTVWDGLGNAASNVRAVIGETIQLGNASDGSVVTIDSDSMDMVHGTTEMLHFGYGEGAAASGTANAPYYTIGTRSANSTVGNYSVAEGSITTASGFRSHAEGGSTIASGDSSHAEGMYSTATGSASHAEGAYTVVNGDSSHVEGFNTAASGDSSHAEGQDSVASGDYSHAQNVGTIAASDNQTALGAYNVADANNAYAVIVGNGTSGSTRSNALTVDWQGNVECAGTITPTASSSTVTATTANATIINGVNHCWTNNATTTITVGVNLKSSLANSSAVAIATAPADFRPPYTVVGSVYVTGQAVNLQAWIDNAGRITVNNRSGTSVTTSANIYISFTFAP